MVHLPASPFSGPVSTVSSQMSGPVSGATFYSLTWHGAVLIPVQNCLLSVLVLPSVLPGLISHISQHAGQADSPLLQLYARRDGSITGSEKPASP